MSPSRRTNALAAVALFFSTAAFTLWQNTRVAVLWDLSYLLDSAYRFSLGQVPYKDLPFAYAPLTFLFHAAIIRAFGRIYYPHLLCAPLEAGLATVLTWGILLRLNCTGEHHREHRGTEISASALSWPITALLVSPLIVVGIYGIYPHPIYDSDAILIVLLAIFVLQRADANRVLKLLSGALCVLPLFFKQNIGLAFSISSLSAVVILAILRYRQRQSIEPQLWTLAGAAATLALAIGAIHTFFGLRNYLYWTITFARLRRLPGVATMLTTYHQTSLLWTVPAAVVALIIVRRKQRWAHPVAILLLAAPFLWTIASLAFLDDPSDRADQLLSLWPHLLILSSGFALWNLRLANLKAYPVFNTLLPAVLVLTIDGTFLSQQLWGSTYALWPLLMLLIAGLLIMVPAIARELAIVIAVTFLVCGGLYATSHERLSYIHLDGPLARATLPALRGMATPGPWIPAFEELVRVTNAEIPPSEGVLLIPGENPFYFATGRTPAFPILLFDPTTDPYTPIQTRDQARIRNIRWLIVNRDMQLAGPPAPDLPEVIEALQQDFTPYRTLTHYIIYRRK